MSTRSTSPDLSTCTEAPIVSNSLIRGFLSLPQHVDRRIKIRGASLVPDQQLGVCLEAGWTGDVLVVGPHQHMRLRNHVRVGKVDLCLAVGGNADAVHADVILALFTAWIMTSQLEVFQSILVLRRLAISLIPSYSQPMPLPVFGSTKLSGVYAFSVTAMIVRPLRWGREAASAEQRNASVTAALTMTKSTFFMRSPAPMGLVLPPLRQHVGVN